MKYCCHCGAPVSLRIPSGDNLPRFVCDRCQTVHYQNPKMVVGCIPEWSHQVLLCRRAIEPRHGLWTLPAGFMENGETTLEAAVRETREEANAAVEIGSLFALFNLPHINQVYLIFRSRLLSPEHSPGIESLETALFAESEIPWDELAFPVMRYALEHYFADHRAGRFDLHIGELRGPRPPR